MGRMTAAGLMSTMLLALSFPAHSQQYTLSILGDLPGGLGSAGSAINASGQVAGSAFYETTFGEVSEAFVCRDGYWQYVAPPPGDPFSYAANAINTGGQMAGYTATPSATASSGPIHAFLSGNGSTQDLGTLPGYPDSSYATGINAGGTVTGYSKNAASGDSHAFLYGNGTMTDMNSLLSSADSATYELLSGMAINDGGQVTGSMNVAAAADRHAYLFSGGRVLDLGTLPGGTYSEGYGINNGGQVTGTANDADNASVAFLYSNGNLQDLGYLPGFYESDGYGVNNQGQVVGIEFTPSGQTGGFLVDNGVMYDLTSLLTPQDQDLYTVTAAGAINDLGQILGYGYQNSDPFQFQLPILLTPVNAIVASSVTLTASPGTTTAYSPVSLVAAVSPNCGGAIPTGTVNFNLGTTTIGSAPLIPQPSIYPTTIAQAVLTTSALPVGSDAITASYLGSAAYSPSTAGPATITVTPAKVVTTPVISPSSLYDVSPLTVTISDSTPNSTIYYTTNGSTPTTASPKYTGPITITKSTTIAAIAAASGLAQSSVASIAYTIEAAPPAPTFSPGGGNYGSGQLVRIFDAYDSPSTGIASIYYTTDGSKPTSASTLYSSPEKGGTGVLIAATTTLQAIAIIGNGSSAVASATYTINNGPAAAPVFSLPAGPYTAPQTLLLTDTTPGATIYYTLDGTTPTTASAQYTGYLTLNGAVTVEAIAAAPSYTQSPVASAAYVIAAPTTAAPVLSVPTGTYSSAQTVAISDATAGAAIYYTVNGTMPTTSSARYTGPLLVTSSETLQAVAVARGDLPSAVVSATYTLPALQAKVTSPANGSKYPAPASYTLVVQASGGVADLTGLKIFNGTALLANVPLSSLSASYTLALTNVAAGTYAYSAVATNALGGSVTSNVVDVTVQSTAQTASAAMLAPANGSFFVAPATITLLGKAASSAGRIQSVQFFEDEVLVGTAARAPYSLTLSGLGTGSHTFLVAVTDANGTVRSTPVAVTIGTAASLSVTSPVDGAAITDDLIATVSGTVKAPPNSGVTVNGIVAPITANGQFFANDVPLNPGSNTIQVTLTAPDGTTTAKSLTVDSTGVKPFLFGTATTGYHSATSGLLPEGGVFSVAFTLTDIGNAAATRAVLDCGNGGQALQTTGLNLSGVPNAIGTCAYGTAGAYAAGVTVYSNKKIVYTNAMTIVVQDPTALDDLLRSLWSGMNDALTAGRQTDALAYLDHSAQINYGPVFAALSGKLPALIASYSDLTTSLLTDLAAEYLITLEVQGSPASFLIYFVNAAGIWQVESM